MCPLFSPFLSKWISPHYLFPVILSHFMARINAAGNKNILGFCHDFIYSYPKAYTFKWIDTSKSSCKGLFLLILPHLGNNTKSLGNKRNCAFEQIIIVGNGQRMRGPTGQNKISCKRWKSFSKMSKLILQTLETCFKNPERGIFKNNAQMKFLVKHVCVFFSLQNVKTGFMNLENRFWKSWKGKVKRSGSHHLIWQCVCVMWLCIDEEYHRKNNKQKSGYLSKYLSLSSSNGNERNWYELPD